MSCSISLLVLPQARAQELQARAQTGAQSSAQSSERVNEKASQEGLNQLSDTQLTNLAADWSSLNEQQRSLLIQETQQRMQPQPGAKPQLDGARQAASLPVQQAPQRTAQQSPQQTTQQTTQRRRYGRLVRKADGSVVRSVVQSVVQIETRTVRVQEGDRRRAYGMGFEQRHDRKYPSTLTPVSGPSNRLPAIPEPSAPFTKSN